jgi:hypothetical protein
MFLDISNKCVFSSILRTVNTKHDVFYHYWDIYVTAIALFLSLSIYIYIKVKLSLCLTKHHAVKTYGGVEV